MRGIQLPVYGFKLISLVIAMIASLGTQSYANSITYTNYSVLNNQTVEISDATLNIINEYGGSGQITLFNLSTGGFLTTWCVDIADDLLSSGSFTGVTDLTGPIGDTINALISHVSPSLDSDYNASSALQVAIWEAKYGPNLNIAAPQPVLNEANSFLANVASGVWTADRTQRVAVLNGGSANQDQAYLVPVPEPMSIALVATALLAASLGRSRSTLKLAAARHVVRRRSRRRTDGTAS